MQSGGQKSWRRVPKYRVIRSMATLPSDSLSDTEHQTVAAADAECQSDGDYVKHEEDNGIHHDSAIHRVEKIVKKSPRAYRVLADVMHHPQPHSKGGRMFLKQRQRLDKLAAEESNKNQENNRKITPLPLHDENARLSSWELAAVSPVAVKYITKKSNAHHGKRWSPFAPGFHLPQPPDLWRSKVEKDFPPVSKGYPYRNLPRHSRTLSDGNYVGMYNGNFPPGTIRFDARPNSHHENEAKWTSRFGRVERDFNARPKGWVKVC